MTLRNGICMLIVTLAWRAVRLIYGKRHARAGVRFVKRAGEYTILFEWRKTKRTF